MSTLAERLAEATARLAPVTDTPRIDAEVLLAHALTTTRARLLARLSESPEAPGFDGLLARRLAFEPLAYILGEWEFFSMRFITEPPILVPRPETEHLVEAVLEHVGKTPARVLEIGTGSGCVSIAVAVHAPGCRVVATDINPDALVLARRNASRHGVAERIVFRRGDVFAALESHDAPFDVICSNPPYVEEEAWSTLSPVIRLHEDPQALLAGEDGLSVIRRLVREAPQRLKPRGLLAFEIGMGQYGAVGNMVLQYGYRSVAFRRDLAGIERVAVVYV